jgi:hypothetical protein
LRGWGFADIRYVVGVKRSRVGLRHRKVVLEEQGQIAAVGDRGRAAGIATEEYGRGFLVRDPWEIAVLFVTPEGPVPREESPS